MSSAPIVPVPGFWLGAWAWDTVADTLRTDGHTVTALTLPGREPDRSDRGSVTMSEQADAICAAIDSAGRPVVLAVHSGSSQPGFEATARLHGVLVGPVQGGRRGWAGLDGRSEGTARPQLDRHADLALAHVVAPR